MTENAKVHSNSQIVDDLLAKYGFSRLNWEADPALMADLIVALDERSGGPSERDAALDDASYSVLSCEEILDEDGGTRRAVLLSNRILALKRSSATDRSQG